MMKEQNFDFSQIKYLIFDLDDTLLRRDRSISSFTLDVLKKAQELGYLLVINTSRSYQNCESIIEQVHPNYGIYNGGCQIVKKDGHTLYSILIPDEVTQRVTKYLNSICPKISVQTPSQFLASDASYKGQNAVYTDFSDGYCGPSYKILCLNQNHDLIEQVAEDNDLDYQNYLNSGWHRLSVHGGNKWNGILKLLELTGGVPSQVMVFGDDFGDLEMITNCGVGVAMGNSQPILLKKAPFVTLTNQEDGLAHFVQDKLQIKL